MKKTQLVFSSNNSLFSQYPSDRGLDLGLKDEIRKKYIPYRYGKVKLAEEYGVSSAVIYRILKGQSWK
jgi:hypothetical protein